MTGVPWIEESGLLASPIALTNTARVGLVRDAITRYAVDRFAGRGGYWLPLAAETYLDAAADAVEESILNALTAAETMTEYQGHVAYALPLDKLKQVLARYRGASRPGF